MPVRLGVDLDGVRGTAELLPELAPRTVAAFLDLLPVADRAVHGRWSGQVVWVKRPLPDLPEENPVHLPAPGSLVLLHGAGEIMLVVGEAAIHSGLGLPRSANRFGQLADGAEAICLRGRRLNRDGARQLRLWLQDR